MSADERLVELADELGRVAEELADLALSCLRRAADPDDPAAAEAAAEERRITRARRAVEKAAAVLGGPTESFDS